MPNVMTLTTPLARPSLVSCRILRADEVDDTAKRMVVELEFTCSDDSIYPVHPRLAVQNGTCDTFGLDGLTFGTAEVPDGFQQVMGAYVTTVTTGAMLAAMAALGLIPPGTVA